MVERIMSDGLPGRTTETSLTLRPGLTIIEWAEALRLLGTLHRGSPWWVGDAIAWGETHFGEKYAQYVEETGLSVKTLLRRARLSRQVASDRRHPDLSLTHHEAVMNLLPAQQDELLDRAASEGWTAGRLKAEARKADVNHVERDRTPLGTLGDDLYEAAIRYLDEPAQREDLIRACARWAERRDL